MPALNQQSLDVIFNEARTHSAWQDKSVGDELLQQIYEEIGAVKDTGGQS